MATPFTLSVLTPDRTVFEGTVEYVQVPGTEGYLGVLAHHAALVTGLAEGALTLRRPGGSEAALTVSGGFFEVSNNRATVLADAVRDVPKDLMPKAE
jgi:F-type H+-transporting ATPase subunit epsilon